MGVATEEFEKLIQDVNLGRLHNCPRQKLEEYSSLLVKGHARGNFNETQYAQVCDTIKTLLISRISEEANKESKRISIIALGISLAALICAVLQVIIGAYDIHYSSETKSSQTIESTQKAPAIQRPKKGPQPIPETHTETSRLGAKYTERAKDVSSQQPLFKGKVKN